MQLYKTSCKNTFLLMIQVLKASQNKGEIGEVQSNEHEQLKKKLVFRNSGTSWNKI